MTTQYDDSVSDGLLDMTEPHPFQSKHGLNGAIT